MGICVRSVPWLCGISSGDVAALSSEVVGGGLRCCRGTGGTGRGRGECVQNVGGDLRGASADRWQCIEPGGLVDNVAVGGCRAEPEFASRKDCIAAAGS